LPRDSNGATVRQIGAPIRRLKRRRRHAGEDSISGQIAPANARNSWQIDVWPLSNAAAAWGTVTR